MFGFGLGLGLGLGWSDDLDDAGAGGAGAGGRVGDGEDVVMEFWGIEGPVNSLMRAISSSRVHVS